MNKRKFFNLDPHQSVSSTLVGILLVSWCVWMVVAYINRGVSMIESYKGGTDALAAMINGKK
jgi:hypothetical protein